MVIWFLESEAIHDGDEELWLEGPNIGALLLLISELSFANEPTSNGKELEVIVG